MARRFWSSKSFAQTSLFFTGIHIYYMEERGRIIDRFYVVFGPRKVETTGVYIFPITPDVLRNFSANKIHVHI
jgi:hypothetical protein